jgi:acetylornithine deacetylase/succinyl-diaminopimelate desuccinylase family protein
MTRTEKMLGELIALPSVNPAFLPAAHPRAGETRVAEYLAAKAAKAGLDIERQQVLTGRSNLLARLSPSGKARRHLLLAPHLDTVNGTDDQFVPQRKNGRLFGRGACDTKGSVTAMITALCELAETGPRPAETEIIFAGLVDEEDAQRGSRALAASRLKADFAIVGEPTCLKVVTAHKGSLWLRLETRGKAAHGALPELGRNAVLEMARVVEALETDYAKRLARRRHALLGQPTVNVGVINGGTQANIVPDKCFILVDRRTLPGETEASVTREITALLRQRGLRAVSTDGRMAPCLPLETDPGLPLVTEFLRCAGQKRPAGVNYFCDASVLAQGGIPSIVFGPGNIAHAHTAEEWISLDSLEKARGLLLRFLRSLP